MRSRYCAFFLGKLGRYLIQTWHHSALPDITVQELDQVSKAWVGLQIVSGTEKGDLGSVEFKASYIELDTLKIHHETSRFLFEQDQWFYLDGSLVSEPEIKISRNQQCPCNSKKKFKACHGKNL